MNSKDITSTKITKILYEKLKISVAKSSFIMNFTIVNNMNQEI